MLNKTRLKSTRNNKLPSIAGTDGSDGLMVGESLPLQHIMDNPFNVQCDDCPAAFVGFQEEAVVGVVFPELVAGTRSICNIFELQSLFSVVCMVFRCFDVVLVTLSQFLELHNIEHREKDVVDFCIPALMEMSVEPVLDGVA